MDRIIERALKGDPRSIARLITAVESENDRAKEIMQKIYPHTGKAHMIGVTGSPAQGKAPFLTNLSPP